MKVALIAGLFIASPAVFLEIWKFIAPGLYETERRMARPFVIFATHLLSQPAVTSAGRWSSQSAMPSFFANM